MILVDQVQRLTLILTKTGGTGLTVDYLEGTENKDVVNQGTKGITVNLGGSEGDADVFTGSANSTNDFLDAREAYDLAFTKVTGSWITFKLSGDSEVRSDAVTAHLKDVDYIWLEIMN